MPEPEINGAFQVAPRGGNSEGEQRAQPVPAAPGGQRGPQGAGGSRQWRVAVCPCRPPPAASGVCAPVVTRVPSARSIDCAGVLKLRNSDIELRKGETDIGRKNTRVRLVFRVHIPQPDGRTLSLQVASNPIECCECPRQAGRPRAGACPSQARPSFLLVCVCRLRAVLPVTHTSLCSHGHSAFLWAQPRATPLPGARSRQRSHVIQMLRPRAGPLCSRRGSVAAAWGLLPLVMTLLIFVSKLSHRGSSVWLVKPWDPREG